IAYRLLQPALGTSERSPVQVRQDAQERLIEELVAGRLHLVITESPPSSTPPRVHVHRLGETTMYLYGTRKLAARYGRSFPRGLEGAPVLVPAAGGLRRNLERWFAERSLSVRIE